MADPHLAMLPRYAKDIHQGDHHALPRKKAVPKDGELPNIIGTLERTPKIEEQLRIIAL